MVIWKSYRSLVVGLVSGDVDLQAFTLFLLMVLPWAAFQFAMLKKCRRKCLRLLPLLFLSVGIITGEVMTVMVSGWDGLGWGILTNYLSYYLLGALCGAVVWIIHRGRKNRADE